MNIRYIDVHCHLQFPEFDEGRDEILEEMKEKGIAAILVGTEKESSERAIALAEPHEHLFATVGLHPNDSPHEEWDGDAFRKMAQHPKVVAIGECGFDFFRPEDTDIDAKERQENIFRAQLQLAQEVGKPAMVHARPSKGAQDAYHETARLLREYEGVVANMHFFVGGVEEVDLLSSLGATFSYPGVVTFARDYDDPVRRVPNDRIMTETDAPYAAPKNRRGKRNDPLSIPEILEALAAIREEDTETLREAVLKNAKNTFSL
jgi:TatD DNase family protein